MTTPRMPLTREGIKKEIEAMPTQSIEQLKEKYPPERYALLPLYVIDAQLAIHADLKQKNMIWLTGWLGWIYAVIEMATVAFVPIFAASLLQNLPMVMGLGMAVTGWGMVLFATIILASKIEGIIGLLAAEKAANNSACRQLFKNADTMQTGEDQSSITQIFENALTNIQTTMESRLASTPLTEAKINIDSYFSDMKKSMRELIEPTHVNSMTGMAWIAAQAWGILKYWVVLAESPFNFLVARTNDPASQNEIAWMELIECLAAVAEEPLNFEARQKLEMKSEEVSRAATFREIKEGAEVLSKAALFGSFYLTTGCFLVISVAILGFGATASSPILVSALGVILISKGIFIAGAALTLLKMAWALTVWAFNNITARIAECCCRSSSSDNDEKKQSPVQKNPQDKTSTATQHANAAEIDANLLSPLKQLSLFARKISHALPEPDVSSSRSLLM